MRLIFKCHLTAGLLLELFTCEIVQGSFDNINENERLGKMSWGHVWGNVWVMSVGMFGGKCPGNVSLGNAWGKYLAKMSGECLGEKFGNELRGNVWGKCLEDNAWGMFGENVRECLGEMFG